MFIQTNFLKKTTNLFLFEPTKKDLNTTKMESFQLFLEYLISPILYNLIITLLHFLLTHLKLFLNSGIIY